MYHNFRVIIFCLFISLPLSMSGQGTGNSPFSQFGVGDLTNNTGSVRNIGMGYAGVSARHHHYINLLNPALLPNLKSTKKVRPNHTYRLWDYYRNLAIDSTVKIDFALNYQNRSIQSATGYENASGINVAYLAFALPISKTWGTSIGIQPYSSANYDLVTSAPVTGNPNTYSTQSNTGRGGIYKMFLANGFSINDNISLGLETAFVFGNINNEIFSTVTDFSSKNYGFKRQTTYSGFSFKPGFNFRREIVKSHMDTVYAPDSNGLSTIKKLVRKTESSGVFYNIGLTYDFFSNMDITRSLNLYVLGSDNRISSDTTIQKDKYKTQMPSTIRLGASLDSPLKWTLAADVFFSPWSNYKPGFSTDTLGNSYGFSIGGEYTLGKIVKVKSKTVRAGFTYLKTPVIYHGNQLDDMSFSIGGSIPFGKKKRDYLERNLIPVPPKINIGVVFGQRGNFNGFGIKEQYVKVYMGILIQQKWFIPNKIN
jgi:hypothetical protein